MYLDLLARVLLLIGGLNHLFFYLINVKIFSNIPYPNLVKIINVLIGLSAAYFVFDRDYYLPFLGKTVIPVGPIKPNVNLKKIKLTKLPPNTIILSWAAKESDKVFSNYMQAYGDYSNTDVSKTNSLGEVTVQLPCPASYRVSKFGMDKQLDRHIHYRYAIPNNPGMFSRIYTKYLNKECV